VNQGLPQKIISSLTVLACFAVLAWLAGRYVGATNGQVAVYAALGVGLALLGLTAVVGLNLAVDTPVLGPAGFTAVWGVVARGFLVVIPFAVLALLAELVYDWQAAHSFIQAAVMTSGAAAGAELMRQTGGKTRHLVVSTIVAVVLAGAWTVFTYFFQRVAG
jgi:hypothetical protein